MARWHGNRGERYVPTQAVRAVTAGSSWLSPAGPAPARRQIASRGPAPPLTPSPSRSIGPAASVTPDHGPETTAKKKKTEALLSRRC